MAERVGPEEIKVLRFIARREERGDPSPGMREICCATGLEGPQKAQDRISALIGCGCLVQDASWTRMLELTERGWRLLEDLASAESRETSQDGLSRPGDELLDAQNGARRWLLRLSADSLARAGMSEGDLLVVEDDTDPADGELAVATIGGESMILRARHTGGLLELCSPARTPDPADCPRAEPSVPSSRAKIQGRVVYVVRPPVI